MAIPAGVSWWPWIGVVISLWHSRCRYSITGDFSVPVWNERRRGNVFRSPAVCFSGTNPA
jgi:hypothetical protein